MPGQQVVSSSLELRPEPAGLREYCDYFGNRMNSFIITEPHIGMHIKSRSRIRCDQRLSQPPPTQISWEVVSARCAAGECDPVASEFLYASPYVPYLNELREYADPAFLAVARLSRRLWNSIPGFTRTSGSTRQRPTFRLPFRRCSAVAAGFARILRILKSVAFDRWACRRGT